jgi:hypothetical protein
MGVTSSGLLDEERDDEASTTTEEYPPETFIESGQRNPQASYIIGRDVAGTPNVCAKGPSIYTLP